VVLLKKAFPDSLIFGPVSWGWCAYMYSAADGCASGPDRKAHGDLPLIQWYIQQITNNKKTTGQQVVDVIDVHFYPQEPNVFSNKEDPMTALLRLRSPRSLWDPTYIDETWISQPIYILKRIKDWVNEISPGSFKTAVTEYNFGDDDIVTAALANVEALGIYAQENVYIANRWVVPKTGSIAEDAYKLFLNYDGKGSNITGADFISSSTSNIELVSSFVYDNSRTKTTYVVLTNKIASGPVDVIIDVSTITPSGQVSFFQFWKRK